MQFDASEALPAALHEPCFTGSERPVVRRPARLGNGCAAGPSVEESSGRTWVDVRRPRAMLFAIEEHVDQGIAHFAWRTQGTCMISIRPNAPARGQPSVQAPRHADAESLHPAGEAPAVVGFDEQVQVIGLNAEVNDTKKALPGRADLRADTEKQRFLPQTGKPLPDTDRDMDWMASAVYRSANMRHPTPASHRLSPRAFPESTPGISEWERSLDWSHSLIRLTNSLAFFKPFV